MAEHWKVFLSDGDRTTDTDGIAEELARHALLDEQPDARDITLTWVKHYQPDRWLLFVSGITGKEPSS